MLENYIIQCVNTTDYHSQCMCMDKIYLFFSENTAIAISTYNMVAYTQKRAADSQEVRNCLAILLTVSSITFSLSCVCLDDGLSTTEGVGPDDS